MTTFTSHTIESAPEASKKIMKDAEDAYTFLPNLYRNMSEAPSLLEGYTTLSHIFDKSNMSNTERQIILMTNNRLNGCTYCMAAHTTLSQMQGVSEDVIEALRNGTAINDPKLEALRQYAISVNEDRGFPAEDKVKALLDAGYTQQTMLEVIVGTSLKVMSNYTNHIAHTEVDEAFQANVWAA